MEVKLLLLKAIVSLYYFSLGDSKDSTYLSKTIHKVIDRLDIQTDPGETSKERILLSNLKSLAFWMIDNVNSGKFEHLDLMTRLEFVCGEDQKLYNLFVKNLIESDDDAVISIRSTKAIDAMNEFLSTELLIDTLRKASKAVSFDRDSIEDIVSFKRTLMNNLEDIKLGDERKISDDHVLDLKDIGKLTEKFELANDLQNDTHILKFPFKAMNRMTGDHAGAKRGDYSCVVALAGHNKTGNLLDNFISFCIFNDPALVDPEKKPLHVYTTIEDSVTDIITKLYVLLMQQEFGLPVSLRGIDAGEQAEYVSRRLTARGWEVKIIDFENGGTVFSYLDQLKAFEDQGYEIASAGLDYAHLMDQSAMGRDNMAENAKAIHRTIDNFIAPKLIYHYTAHQLSSEARTLLRQFPDDFIGQLVDKGYYEGCRTLNSEFSYEYYTAKRIKDGVAWQEFQWAKHRKLGATEEGDKYFAMKYYPIGMIGYPYDVEDDKDLSYKKVGNRSTQSDGNEWNDF